MICFSGICLYERFQRIQQKLREGQQACDLLFFVALQSLKNSFEVAFDSKNGEAELNRLCAEFDEHDRKKEQKAQKKREKKKSKKKNSTEKISVIKSVEDKSCKMKNSSKSQEENCEPISVLQMAAKIIDDNLEDFDENCSVIPQEEIQKYLREVSGQREELRRNLRKRFNQLCVNGL